MDGAEKKRANRAGPQAKRGKRANNTNSFSAAGRGKPAENGVGFAFLVLLNYSFFSLLFFVGLWAAAAANAPQIRESKEKRKINQLNLILFQYFLSWPPQFMNL